jgi:hypothetical protein
MISDLFLAAYDLGSFPRCSYSFPDARKKAQEKILRITKRRPSSRRCRLSQYALPLTAIQYTHRWRPIGPMVIAQVG